MESNQEPTPLITSHLYSVQCTVLRSSKERMNRVRRKRNRMESWRSCFCSGNGDESSPSSSIRKPIATSLWSSKNKNKPSSSGSSLLKATSIGCIVLTVLFQIIVPSYKLSGGISTSREQSIRLAYPVTSSNSMVSSLIRRNVVLPQDPLLVKFDETTRSSTVEAAISPDYNGLQFQSLQGVNNATNFRRTIHFDQSEIMQAVEDDSTDGASSASSINTTLESIKDNNNNNNNNDNECQPNRWKSVSFPTCNSFHEVAQDRAVGDFKILGTGHYRMAWLIRPATNLLNNNNNINDNSFVLKQLRLVLDPADRDRDVNEDSLSMAQHEAIVMERLTASPRIADIYGYCGVSLQVQTLYGTVEPTILRNDKVRNVVLDSLLSYLPFLGKRQTNGLSLPEKLKLVTTMAEAIADMHGFEGGVVINSDIAAVQFLYDAEGNVRLNDFNIAAFPDWNPKEKTYCKVMRPQWDGRLYAPEQYAGKPIDKQVDVYALANLIYMTLTGRWPFYEIDHHEVRGNILNGRRPSIDKRYRKGNFIERRLVEIMELMWANNPAERPEIFDIVQFLKEAAQRDVA